MGHPCFKLTDLYLLQIGKVFLKCGMNVNRNSEVSERWLILIFWIRMEDSCLGIRTASLNWKMFIQMTRACMCVIILSRIMWAPGQSELLFMWQPLVSEVFLFFLNSCWPVKIIFLRLDNYFSLEKKNNYFPLFRLWQPLKDSEFKKYQRFHQLRSHPINRFSLGHAYTLKSWAIPFSQMSSCNKFKYALDISYCEYALVISYLKHEETYMHLFKVC